MDENEEDIEEKDASYIHTYIHYNKSYIHKYIHKHTLIYTCIHTCDPFWENLPIRPDNFFPDLLIKA